jgi:hypothetical protein
MSRLIFRNWNADRIAIQVHPRQWKLVIIIGKQGFWHFAKFEATANRGGTGGTVYENSGEI